MDTDANRSLASMEGLGSIASSLDLREIFEHAVAGMGIHAPDGTLLWMNRTLRAMLGYSGRECQVCRFEEILEPPDVEAVSQWLTRCAEGKLNEFELNARLITSTGLTVPTRMRMTVLRDAESVVRGFFSHIVEGTSLAETRAALTRQLEFNRVVTALATEFINLPTDRVDDAIVAAIGHIATFVGSDRAGVLLFKDESLWLHYTYEWLAHGMQPLKGAVSPIDADMFPWWRGYLVHRKTVAVEDVTTLDGLSREAAAWLDEYGITSFASRALWVDERAGGLVAFARQRPGCWTADDLALVRVAAELIGALRTRQERERQLAETETRFTQMAEKVRQVFWIAELEPPRVVYASPAHTEIFGISPERSYENPFVLLDLIPSDDRAKFLRLFSFDVGDSGAREVEYRVCRPDGRICWIRTHVFPLEVREERVTRVAGISDEVTDRVVAREELKHRAALDRLVSKLATDFIDLPLEQIDRGLEDALERLGRFIGVDEAYLVVLDPDTEEAVEGHLWGADEGHLDQRVRSFDLKRFPWLRNRLRSGQAAWINELHELPEEAENERNACRRAGVESASSIPLILERSFLGFLGFNSKTSGTTWSDEVVTMLGVAAEMLANALMRRRIGKQLEELQRRNDHLLMAAGEGIYGLDLDGRTTFVNPAAAQMIGWQPDELIGKRQHDILHHHRADGSEYPAMECPISATFQKGEIRRVVDEVFWRKDGTSFPVAYTSTPILDHGRVAGAVVVFRDVTVRKRAEEERAKRESLLSVITHLASQCINLPMEEIDGGIDRALGRIGLFADADRVGLFRVDATYDRASLTNEWRRSDVFGSIQDLPTVALGKFPELREALLRGEPVRVSTSDEFERIRPDVRLRLDPLGIRSFIHIPMRGNRGLLGWLGLATVGREKKWNEETVKVLEIAAQTFANILDRKESAIRLARYQRFERVVTELARELIAVPERRFDATIEDSLAVLGRAGNFEHCQICLLEESSSVAVVTYGWAREEVAMLPVGAKVPLVEYPWLTAHLVSGQVATISSLSKLPEEANATKRMLQRWGIKSLLYVPIADGTRPVGVITFACVYEEEEWPAPFVSLVRVASDMIANAINRYRSEDRARKRHEELLHVLRLGTMSELAADIIHEVGQPLTAITNFVNGCKRKLLDGDDVSGTLVDAVRDIGAEASRAQAILRSAQSHVRRSEPQFVWVDLNRVIEECLVFVRREYAKQKIRLVVQLSSSIMAVQIDPVQIQQVVINLLRNALEALSEAGVHDGRVCIHSSQVGDGGVAVTVEDNGPGIAPEVASRVFTAFFSTKQNGLGLGLSISHSIIESHGGRLSLERNGAGGVVFRFVLPSSNGRGTFHV